MVITAENGDDCLKQLEKVKPDLILMDIMVPGTPVKEIVPKIKDIRLAYLTVVRLNEAEKEGLVYDNVMDFIQKPFNIDGLIEKIRKLVKMPIIKFD